jgi:fructose-1,6-bisphosphatase/inositol monophosphatase family enzyme
MKVSKKMANNELKYQHNLTFNSDETKEVYLIGSNSVNYFYVVKGEINVRISPVGAIKTLEFKNPRNR